MIYHTRALPSCGASISTDTVLDRLSVLVAHANKIGQKVVVTGKAYSVTKDGVPVDRFNFIVHVTGTEGMDLGLFGCNARDYETIHDHLHNLADAIVWSAKPDAVLDTSTIIQEDNTPPVAEVWGKAKAKAGSL